MKRFVASALVVMALALAASCTGTEKCPTYGNAPIETPKQG